MTQNPPFPSPEELKAKLSEFMKTNFGDKVAFTTYTEPQTAEAPVDEKPRPSSDEPFVFNFLRITTIVLLAPRFPGHYMGLHETAGILALYSGLGVVWLLTGTQRSRVA